MITRLPKSSKAYDDEIDMHTGTSNYAVSKWLMFLLFSHGERGALKHTNQFRVWETRANFEGKEQSD
jgi:hypothetical protein